MYVCINKPNYSKPSDLPVVSPRGEALFGEHTGPHVKALCAVPVELQLLAALHLLTVLRQDEEWVRRHWVQSHFLWREETGRVGYTLLHSHTLTFLHLHKLTLLFCTQTPSHRWHASANANPEACKVVFKGEGHS